MIVVVDVAIFAIMIATALLALYTRDLLTAVALLATYSLFASLLFTGVLALDVALVEAALGAGLTGVLLIAAIMVTTRRSTARERPRQQAVVLVLVAGFLGLMLYASSGLPDRGDPEAPTRTGVAATYIEQAMDDTQTPNIVTALLADYRSQDTLGETLVILTAALSVALVLRRRPEGGEDERVPDHANDGASDDSTGIDDDAGTDDGSVTDEPSTPDANTGGGR